MPKTKTRESQRTNNLAPTLGGIICRWIESNLVHAEGDYLGQPFRLRAWERQLIYRAYELNDDGSRRYRRVLCGKPKGSGKTELVGALCNAELAGPVVFDGWKEDGTPRAKLRTSPDIPCAAASYKQANILYGAARKMIELGPLAPYFDCYDKEIQPKGRTGRLYRVAAEAGTNDGLKPTFFAADELHEWLGRIERVHIVISNGLAKRRDSWELNITTAGYDRESLLYRMYLHGKEVENGNRNDPSFLFIWDEASPDWDLSDDGQRMEAINEVYSDECDFVNKEDISQRYHKIPDHEWRRYYGNQWTEAPDTWDVAGVWDELMDESREVTKKEPITLGFDGSYNRDSTALIGCTVNDPHLFVVDLWERPQGIKEWSVDKEEVAERIIETFADYNVKMMGYDETFGRIWDSTMKRLEEKGLNIVEWPTRNAARFREGCALFRGVALDGTLSHNGDDRLRAHVFNARYHTDGIRIVKEHKTSERHIDCAVAGVIAYDLAVTGRQPGDFGITVGNYA